MWWVIWSFLHFGLCTPTERDGYNIALETVYREHLVGYTTKRTYLPGEEATFYLASYSESVTECTIGMRYKKHEVASVYNVSVQSWTADDCWNPLGNKNGGCHWNISTSITINKSWPSSIYGISCRGLNGTVDFVVGHLPDPTEPKKVLFITGSYTSLMYNPWGGRSGYGHFSPDGAYVTEYLPAQYLSWNRPSMSPATFGTDGFATIEGYSKHPFVYNYSAFSHRRPILSYIHDYPGIEEWVTITEDRIAELGAEYLSNFKMLVFLGKYEYNTIPMWVEVRKYILGGGKIFMKSHEQMWAWIEDDGHQIYLNGTNCYWWYNVCKGVDYSKQHSGFQWDIDFFGASFQFDVPATNYIASFPSIMDDTNWVAKQLDVKKGKKAWWRSLDSKFNAHLRLKKQKDGKYCPVDGKIPCSNFTLIGLTPGWAAKDSLGRATRVYGMDGVIRHGNGEIIMFTHEFHGGDHKGVPVVLAILNGKKNEDAKKASVNTLGLFSPVVFLFVVWVGACTKRAYARCTGGDLSTIAASEGVHDVIDFEAASHKDL